MSASLKRRALFGLLAAAACPLCAARATEERGAGAVPRWSYEGAQGPTHWGEMQADFRTCARGTAQAPIDLADAVRADTGGLSLAWREISGTVVNNGDTVQVNCEPGSQMTIAGTRFDLLQFHFHHPSEHLLAGKGFDLECHFVHRAATGALAVLGVFFHPGKPHAELEKIFAAMPTGAGAENALPGSLFPAALLPAEQKYFRYMGSLTTPPCSEGVNWTMFRQPVEAAPAQIRRFAALYPNNARPVQGLNRRVLLEGN